LSGRSRKTCSLSPFWAERENLALGNGNNIEEAWKFVEWLNEAARAKALIVAAGQITNREDLAGDPVWAEDPVEKIFLAAIRSAKARAYGPKYPQISEIMYTTFQSIVTGSMTPEEAAKNAEHQLQPSWKKLGVDTRNQPRSGPPWQEERSSCLAPGGPSNISLFQKSGNTSLSFRPSYF
jgi:hypothetical protein